ncbi:MAG: GNAT family N-acetyltransferase [Cytophagales bacterium]|nr:GNAT family N-acetyltransferase [Cytophagales bacterium]
MKNLFFEEVDLSKIEVVRELAHATWPDTFGEILSAEQISYMLEMMYGKDAITKQISILNHVFFLVKNKSEYLGYLSYQLDYKIKGVTKIHKIYVLPAAQGTGAGKALMLEAQKRAIENAQNVLSLNVNRYNKAIGFYEKLGFRKIATEDIDIGNGFLMEDAVMEKPL